MFGVQSAGLEVWGLGFAVGWSGVRNLDLGVGGWC